MIQQSLASALGVENDVVGDLLERLPSYMHPRLPARFDFLAIFGAAAPVPRQTRRAFRRLHKIAMLVAGFRLTLDELTYLASHGLALDAFSGGRDGAAPPPRPSFDQWQMVRGYTRLRDSLPRNTTRLIDVLTAASDESAGDLLQLLTGWKREDIPPAPEARIRTVDGLARLREQFALSRRTGVKISTLHDWATPAPDRAQARQVREATKSKYSDSEWLEVARKLEDGLRENGETPWWPISSTIRTGGVRGRGRRASDRERLYAHFLIDVEMCSCQLTSRIRQAIAAVQLFVQRACSVSKPGRYRSTPRSLA